MFLTNKKIEPPQFCSDEDQEAKKASTIILFITKSMYLYLFLEYPPVMSSHITQNKLKMVLTP